MALSRAKMDACRQIALRHQTLKPDTSFLTFVGLWRMMTLLLVHQTLRRDITFFTPSWRRYRSERIF